MSARSEYELKARLQEDPDGYCDRLESGGWSRRFEGRMADLTFDTEGGRLAASDQVLRLRVYVPDGEGETLAVLGWKGPATTEEGFKHREEVETRVSGAEAAREILGRLGFHRVTRRIDRRIRLLVQGGVSVRVEEYPRMDVLVELEGPPSEVRERIPELGIEEDEWKPWPLPAFVRRFEERTGREALLHRSEAEASGDGGRTP